MNSEDKRIKNLEELLSNISVDNTPSSLINKPIDHTSLQNAHLKDFLLTNIQIRNHREQWSNWILFLIIFTNGSTTVIIFLSGRHILLLSPEVFQYVLFESLIRIFALAGIVVGFLFNEKSTIKRSEIMLQEFQPKPPTHTPSTFPVNTPHSYGV